MSEFPQGWVEAALDEIAIVNPGRIDGLSADTSISFVPMPAVSDVDGEIVSPTVRPFAEVSKGYTQFQEGDVIFAKITPCMENGKIAVARSLESGVACGSTEFHVVRPLGENSPDYIWRFLRQQSFRGDAEASMTGAVGQRRVPTAYLKNSRVPLPPLPEQRRIVAKIDSLTGKSRRARDHLDHIPRLVEKYKQAVLAAAFRGLSTNEPSRKLGDLAQFITSGSRGWAKYYSDHGSLFIRVANVMRGRIELSLSDTQRVSPPDGAEGQRTSVRPADIVVTITADLGRVGIVPCDLGSAYVNQHVALLRLQDRASAPFIAWFLTSESGQRQMLEQNRGMTRAGLGLDDIRNVKLPLPAMADQLKTVEMIETAHTWIDRLASETTGARRLIDRLDQAVLAKAFRGELVPQDPDDEPASVLLDRIKAQRAAVPEIRRGRRSAA